MGILVGGLSAYFAIKKGFYETWSIGFNVIISIYLAVLSGPVLCDIIPAGDNAYSKALTMLVTAAACFLILYGISYTLITGQFSISFPKIVDVVGAGIVGFFAGLLVWSFVTLLIMATPITKNPLVKEVGFDAQAQQTNVSYLSWWCNAVNKVVSSADSEQTAQQAINWSLKSSKAKANVVGASEPNAPAEPNGTELNTAEKQ